MSESLDDAGLMCKGLRHVCDTVRTTLSSRGIREALECGEFTYMDIGYGINDPGLFEEKGEEVIQRCKAWNELVQSGKVRESRGHCIEETSEPVRTGFIEAPELFRSKKPRIPSYAAVPAKDLELGGKELEAIKIDEVVDDILLRMDDAVRERYFDGLSSLPNAAYRENLMRKSLRGSGSHGYLRGCVNALRRLDEWLVQRFGRGHGYRCKPAIAGWFLCENLVEDDDDGHVSCSLVSGLRFAQEVLKFPIEVAGSSVKFLCKAPTKMPKQAPSASVRLLFHFHEVASNEMYAVQLRGVSAAFLVMMLAALRGVDAQRSEFRYVSSNSVEADLSFFVAWAYDSKSKTSMAWACPVRVFGSDAWFEALCHVWEGNDYIFPTSPRGAQLSEGREFCKRPATPYMVLKYLREILQLPTVSMSSEDAGRLRRHSFRHWIANCMRVLECTPSEMFSGGRWKEQSVMPLRYAEEVKFLCHIRVMRKVLTACEEARDRVPLSEWPIFGGWELLSAGSASKVSLDVSPEPAENEGDERDSDTEDADLADEPVASEEVAVPTVPFKRSAARGAERHKLPAGWIKEEQILTTNRVIPHYHGPKGEYSRSVVGAWRLASAAAAASAEFPVGLSVGDSVQVWWTEDRVYFDAVVTQQATDGSTCAQVRYVEDGLVLCHDFATESWRPVSAKPSASDGTPDEGYVVVTSEDASPDQGASGIESDSARKPVSRVSLCGNPECLKFRQQHTGECEFPSPKGRVRRWSEGQRRRHSAGGGSSSLD